MSFKEDQICKNMYGTYYVPLAHKHRAVPQKLLNGEVYEANTLNFIKDNIGDGSIVHAGTYIGDMIPALSSFVKKGIVLCFEPVSFNYDYALRNISLNKLQNVFLFRGCLSNRLCSLYMETEENGKPLGGGSFISKTSKKEKVDAVRLDDLAFDVNNITILHLDVEGHEFEALQGSVETINKNKPFIILEELFGINKSVNMLKGMGYSVIDKIDGNVILKHD